MKVIEVEKCRECPYCQWHPFWQEYYCFREGESIGQWLRDDFPSWCPLEDEK